MATEGSKKATEKVQAQVEKDGGTLPPEDGGVGTTALTGGVTAAETQGDDQNKDLTKKDSGSAVSSGTKSKPGKPGEDYDIDSDPVIPSSVARDQVRRELELFGESATLAGLVENYKGDRDL